MPIAQSGGSNVGSSQIIDNEIINADINSAADIAETKINNEVTSVRGISTGTRVSAAPEAMGVGTNTWLQLGRIFIPRKIKACTKFSIEVTAVTVAGTCKIALFSHDGQTKIFEFTTPTISTTGLKTFTISSVDVPAGEYYIGIVPVSTCSIAVMNLTTSTNAFETISGEPKYSGYITVTAGTVPSTIDPTAITVIATSTLLFQLDK